PDKRQRVVERLLNSSAYAAHFGNFWRDVMLPDNNANVNLAALRFTFENWLRARLAQNVGYDRMVREILTATPPNRRGDIPEDQLVIPGGNQATPVAFALANENKPENLAGSTARIFLAVKLECAQCHDHPHASWSQERFWQYAAFFGGN